MKKLLLLMLTLWMSTSIFAQDYELIEEENTSQAFMPSDPASAPQRRTKSTGLYYHKPAGMLYSRIFSPRDVDPLLPYTTYFTPSFDEFKYVNMSNDPLTTHWLQREILGTNGRSIASDAEGNISQNVLPGDSLTVLYLYNEDNTAYYHMARYENNYSGMYAGQYLYYIYPSGFQDDLVWMGWADAVSRGSTDSSMSTGYSYGHGDITKDDYEVYDAGHYGEEEYRHTVSGTFSVSYIIENIPAPASPMYVDGIYSMGVTYGYYSGDSGTPYGYDPLMNGAVLTMELFDQATGEPFETLTATTGDWEECTRRMVSSRGNGLYGQLKFSKKNEAGEEEPIVIDRALTVKVSGFENDDVDLGLMGHPIQDCDEDDTFTTSEMHVIDKSGTYEVATWFYYGAYQAFSMNFNAIMDKVLVDEDYSRLDFSADGTDVNNVDADGNLLDFDGVLIQTALPWYDAEGNENYSLVDVPEWVTDIAVEAYTEAKNSYKLTFQVEEGADEERSATLYVQCKGYVDSTPITITQLSQEGTDELWHTATFTDWMTILRDGEECYSGEKELYLTSQSDGNYALTMKNLIITLAGSEWAIGTIKIPDIVGTAEGDIIRLYVEESVKAENGDDPNVNFWWGPLAGSIDAIVDGELGEDYLTAYITLKTTTLGDILVVFGIDDTSEPDGISSVNSDSDTVSGIYSVSGQKLDTPVKGVNILRFSDGTTKKILIK